MLGFALLLLLLASILLFQQYPRRVVFSLGTLMFDIKQYVAIFFALISLFVYRKRKKSSVLV